MPDQTIGAVSDIMAVTDPPETVLEKVVGFLYEIIGVIQKVQGVHEYRPIGY